MWFFFVITMLGNWEVEKVKYQYPTQAVCEFFQTIQENELGDAVVTKCEKK